MRFDRMMCLAGALAAASALSGCGGKSGGHHGGGPSPSCTLDADKTQAGETEKVRFTLTATGFAPEVATLDGETVYDAAGGIDKHDGGTVARDGTFTRTYVRPAGASGSHEAMLRVGLSEVTCGAEITIDRIFKSGPRAALLLTSSVKGTGERQAVFRCKLDNDLDITNSSTTDIVYHSGQTTCDLAVPQDVIESATPVENVAPYPFGAGAAIASAMPVVDDMHIERVDGDQSDHSFVFASGLPNVKGFLDYDRCHTAKAEVKYRRPDFTLGDATLVWERVQDPVSGKKLWKMRTDDSVPSGLSIRAAMQTSVAMYFYCNWTHEPGRIVLGTGGEASGLARFTNTADLLFDADILVAGEQRLSARKATAAQLESELRNAGLDAGLEVDARLTVRDKSGAVVATNDASLAEAAACPGLTSKATTRKLQDKESYADTSALDLTLCETRPFTLPPLQTVTTKHEAIQWKQAGVKCEITDATFSSSWVWKSGRVRCGWGRPAGDEQVEHLLPQNYAPGGALSEQVPIVDRPELTLGSNTFVSPKIDILELPFSRPEDCDRFAYEVRYKRNGVETSSVTRYHRVFEPTGDDSGVRYHFKWALDAGQTPPTPQEIQALAPTSFKTYYYCKWRPDLVKADPVPGP